MCELCSMSDFAPSRMERLLRRALTAPDAVRQRRYAAAPGNRPQRASATRPVRQAAVLLALVPDAAHWSAVLMERTPYPGVHGGQISIPGGEVEPGDPDRLATALREFEEEMGVAVPRDQVLGQLTPLFIPPSGFEVDAFVVVLPQEPVWTPDPREVAAVLRLPVLPRPSLQRMPVAVGKARMHVPAYPCAGHVVWGATAILITELFEAVDWARAST